MASRYTNNETKKLNDGRNVYRSRIYPEIPLSDNDIYVASETGDRLDTLAYQYYNNSSYSLIFFKSCTLVTFLSIAGIFLMM